MSALFAFLFLGSGGALLISLINPKWGMPFPIGNKTRWKAFGIYGAAAVISLSVFGALEPASTEISQDSGATETNVVEGEAESDTASETVANQSIEVITLGSRADVRNDRAITVNSSEEVAEISINNEFTDPIEAKGGKLIVVYLTMENTGNESGDMFWTQFELVDDQGRTYKEVEDFLTLAMWLEEKGLEDPSNQLFPGGSAETARVFRVAPDASNLMLLVNEQSFAI